MWSSRFIVHPVLDRYSATPFRSTYEPMENRNAQLVLLIHANSLRRSPKYEARAAGQVLDFGTCAHVAIGIADMEW